MLYALGAEDILGIVSKVEVLEAALTTAKLKGLGQGSEIADTVLL